jgi:hypothetical protein
MFLYVSKEHTASILKVEMGAKHVASHVDGSSILILSRVRGSVTPNNGFWIG